MPKTVKISEEHHDKLKELQENKYGTELTKPNLKDIAEKFIDEHYEQFKDEHSENHRFPQVENYENEEADDSE